MSFIEDFKKDAVHLDLMDWFLLILFFLLCLGSSLLEDYTKMVIGLLGIIFVYITYRSRRIERLIWRLHR